MKIGIPTETKTRERRVVLDPSGVSVLVRGGHEVRVQSGAGNGAGFGDETYRAVGATVVDDLGDVWASELVIKVKEPQPEEFQYFRSDLKLFCYLHLAAEPDLTGALLEHRVEAHAFETVTSDGALPLLSPMSEIAGRAATIFGAAALATGSGVLLSGAAGVPPATVAVIGMGIAGCAAARSARGQDAHVIGLDVNLDRLYAVRGQGFVGATQASNESNIAEAVASADLVVGAALVAGQRAPTLVRREHLRSMRPGSVFVDLAIDQGGCAETSRPTKLDDPTFVDEGVIHYCVTNVPGQYPRTASRALSAAVAPRALAVANGDELTGSLNTVDGRLAHEAVELSLSSS